MDGVKIVCTECQNTSFLKVSPDTITPQRNVIVR